MARIFKKRTTKVGLPPGTLVHVGEKRAERVRITVSDYDETHFDERRVESVEEAFGFKDTPTVTWINIDGVHDLDLIERLGTHYGVHALVLEDIVNTGQRPKTDDLDDYLFVVLKMLYRGTENNDVQSEQVSLILGNNLVISFQEQQGDVFDPIRDRLRTCKGRIRKMGADYLAYALVDAITDNYFVVIETLADRVEGLEEELITDPTPATLHAINTLKREVLFLRKSVWPLREVIAGLERGESPLLSEPTRIYFRDVYDHTIQVIDTIETLRDMLSGMLDIYLSSISNKMNEVMKALTITATIFIPLTFIAGIYGMNFEHMPELGWRWAYPALLLVMASIGVLMLVYFKKKRWL